MQHLISPYILSIWTKKGGRREGGSRELKVKTLSFKVKFLKGVSFFFSLVSSFLEKKKKRNKSHLLERTKMYILKKNQTDFVAEVSGPKLDFFILYNQLWHHNRAKGIRKRQLGHDVTKVTGPKASSPSLVQGTTHWPLLNYTKNLHFSTTFFFPP